MIDPAYGEPLQGQRYDVGQEFKAHTDYFEPGGADYDRFCSVAGQRTWTFMVYLNAVDAGGAPASSVHRQDDPARTRQAARLEQPPARRQRQSGATLHHGMKFARGRNT